MVLYLVNSYWTFKSSRNFTVHTCKAGFWCCFKATYTGMESAQQGRAPAPTSTDISGWKRRFRSSLQCLSAWTSGTFNLTFPCSRIFRFDHQHSCKERKSKAWNLLLSLFVSCLFWEWKNVSQARPKTPSAKKGNEKFQRVYFKHISMLERRFMMEVSTHS